MITRAYDRSTDIAAELGRVAAYVSSVPNLPIWTTFFRAVGELQGGRYAVDTLLGPAQTWIQPPAGPEQHVYTICSLIGDRLERADMTLDPQPGHTRFTFTIRLPETLPAERVEHQLEVLQRELLELKRLLEGGV